VIRVFSFLKRDSSSGLLHFRYVVPERYRLIFGRREIKRSLKTADKRIAFPLAMRYYSEIQAQIQKIEGFMAKKPKKDSGFFFEKIDIAGLDVRKGTAKSIVIDYGDDPAKELAALEKIRAMLGGAVQAVTTPAPVVGGGRSDKLSVLCKKYREEKLREGSWIAKTADSHEALHLLLISILGNVESATVTRSHAVQVKEILLKLPANMDKSPQFRGKSYKQILAMNPEPQGIKTVIDKITKLRALFQWAHDNEACPSNPFQNLKPTDGRRARDQKKRFTDDDLQALFDPNRFNSSQLDSFKFFMPLLALHTGARVGELANLRTVDVQEKDGITILDLNDEVKRKKTKSSVRRIPLHPYLLEVGFADYVAKIQQQGHERLFPDACRNITGASDKMSDWFNRTYLPNTEIDRDKKSFHSFRHTFADSLKQLDVPTLKIEAFTGHADSAISTGTYGKDYPMSTLYEVVCKLNFGLKVK
jgi:integrase